MACAIYTEVLGLLNEDKHTNTTLGKVCEHVAHKK